MRALSLAAAAMRERGLWFVALPRPGPGRPAFAFQAARVAVFVDSDFWLGRYREQVAKLPLHWRQRIAINRRKVLLEVRRLRQEGWAVFRCWAETVEADPSAFARRVERVLERPGR